MSVTFTVRGWIDDETFRKLLAIADYVGREPGVGAKFILSATKVRRNRVGLDDILTILEEAGVAITEDLEASIRRIVRPSLRARLAWMGSEVVMTVSGYLGDRLAEIRGMVSYDRSLRAFKVVPYRFFELKERLTSMGIEVADETGLKESMKLPFKVSLKTELRDYQEEALETWLTNGMRGIIALPTGSGKTVIAIAGIVKACERTLIVTYTKEQMFQWEEMLKRFTDIPWEYIGLYYGEEKKLAPITISTYQTAFRHVSKLAPFYSMLIVDECLVGDTLVVMEDGGVKEIKDLRDGERVLGGVVCNKFSRRSSNLYYVRSSFTDLVATATHPHIVIRLKDEGNASAHSKPLEDVAVIVPTHELRPGDYLLVPERIPHVTKVKWTPEQLRLVALVISSGYIEDRTPTIKVVVRRREDKEWMQRAFIEGVKAFNVNDPIRVDEHGDRYVLACYSPRLAYVLTERFGVPRGQGTHALDIPNEVFYSPLSSIKAFIEVCFSCMGRLEEENGDVYLCLACTSRRFTLKLQLLLKKFGVHSEFSVENDGQDKLYKLHVRGADFNKLMDMFSFPRASLSTSKRNNSLKSAKSIGPFRLVRVVEVKPLSGEADVYDFTSNGTHTFLANGVLTHNCHHLPADKFREIAVNMFAPHRMGLSATPVREDGKHEELFPIMGGVVYFKEPKELAGRGYLAPYVIRQVYVELTDEEKKEYRRLLNAYRSIVGGMRFQEVLSRAKRGDPKAVEALRIHNSLRQLVHKAQNKIKAVKRIVETELRRGGKIIIFTQYLDQAYELGKALGALVLTGETPTSMRSRVLSEFKEGKERVLVVTTVGDEGLDIPDVDVGIIVAGTGSRRQFVQRLGRLLRPKPGKQARLYEVIVKGTSEEAQARRRKRITLSDLLT